jgi:ribonuclease HII
MLKTFYNEDTLEVGIDEAGRGPMFGRVYSAATIIPQDDTFKQPFIKDSKKLSEKKRNDAYDYIINNAIDWSVTWKDEKYVDSKNIYNATYDSMHQTLRELNVKPEYILVDGSDFQIYVEDCEIIPHRCVVKGDNAYASIAAASILAKVSRDRYINDMCDKFPLLDTYYDLRNNKGYGTKKHMEGIRHYGISPWHRKTFGICNISKINKVFLN